MKGLVRIGGRYYFRQRVPKDLRQHFPMAELKRSLQTSRYRTALSLAKQLVATTEQLFMVIRSKVLDDALIKRMVAVFLKSKLDYLEERRNMDTQSDDPFWQQFHLDHAEKYAWMTNNEAGVNVVSDAFARLANELKKDLATGKATELFTVVDAAESLIYQAGVVCEKSSPKYIKLCRELLKAEIQAFQIESERIAGNFDSEIERQAIETTLSALQPPPSRQNESLSTKVPDRPTYLLSTVMEQYLQQRKTDGEQTEATQKKYRQQYTLFLELLGDRDIRDYTHFDLREARNKLQRLPANRNTSARYKSLSVDELLQMDIPHTMDKRTINSYMGQITAIFRYAEIHHMIDKRIGESLNFKITKEEKIKRSYKLYEQDEIHRMFKILPFKKRIHYEAWLPLLALYTGARQGELCQLYVNDVKQQGDIFYLDILTEFNEDDPRRVKNIQSRRMVPIHPFIIEVGFLEFVEKLRTKGKKELCRVKSDYYGKQFRALIPQITTGERKVFHSFRSNFHDGLKQKNVPMDLYHAITGHSSRNEMDDIYTEDYSLQIKYDAMLKLDYGLDLEMLKNKYKKLL